MIPAKLPRKRVETMARNELEREYQKQIKRIRQFIQRAEKRGYDFGEISIRRPKRITAGSIRKLKKIKPENLYKKATYTTPEGTRIKGTEGRKYERRKAAKKGVQTRKAQRERYDFDYGYDYEVSPGSNEDLGSYEDNILTHAEDALSNWRPQENWTVSMKTLKIRHHNTLEMMLRGAINREGREAVAKRCEENADYFIDNVNTVLYDSDEAKVNSAMGEISRVIFGSSIDHETNIEFTEQGYLFDSDSDGEDARDAFSDDFLDQ